MYMPSYGHSSLVYACLMLPQSNKTCVLQYIEYIGDYRLRLPFVLPPPEDLASATLPFPPLVARMALRTLRTPSPVSFLAFFWRGSLSIFCMRERLAAFSCSMGASVGSNYKPKSTLCVPKGNSGRTLRFTPFNFFSPSRALSNLPMLAVLIREVASVLLISPLRCSLDEGPAAALSPCARAIFCVIRRSFLVTRAFRSTLAILEGSWSMSVELLCERFWQGKSNLVRTSVRRDLREPLVLKFLVLPFPSPSINPLLLLLVPNGLLLLSV